MNEVQAFAMMYRRHDQIVARDHRRETAEARTPAKFADSLPAAAEPVRIATADPTVVPPKTEPPPAQASRSTATVDLSEGQMTSLMAAFGTDAPPMQAVAADPGKPVAKAAAAASDKAAAPALSPDQAALLLQSFGIAGHDFSAPAEDDEAAPDAEKPLPPQAQAGIAAPAVSTGRFFPANAERKVASLDAADAYLGAIQNMERNLARYGVK